MKVFIAGATGAIGHPLISRLVAAGHDVVGMTSSERGLQTLREAGAEGVVANALDAQAVQVAMNKARPDAVIEELTSLPKHYRSSSGFSVRLIRKALHYATASFTDRGRGLLQMETLPTKCAIGNSQSQVPGRGSGHGCTSRMLQQRQ